MALPLAAAGEDPPGNAAAEAGRAEDAGEKARPGWTFGQSAGGSVNPLGLTIDSRIFYTWPLFRGLRGDLWNSSRIEAGLHNSLTPAFDTVSVFIRFEPLAVFDIYASAGLRGYYDLFGFGYAPLGGYDAPWDSATLKDSERFTAGAFRYSFTATLKGAAGPFRFASATTCTVYDVLRADSGSDYYFDPSADTALKRFDGFITNDTVLLYTIVPGIQAGGTHFFLYVPGSAYVSQRAALLCRVEGSLGPSVTASAAFLGGAYLRNRYNSCKDGKIYAALQAGITVKL
jgi:hypothetical protein